MQVFDKGILELATEKVKEQAAESNPETDKLMSKAIKKYQAQIALMKRKKAIKRTENLKKKARSRKKNKLARKSRRINR